MQRPALTVIALRAARALAGAALLAAALPAPAAAPDPALVERGKYLATAADCTACHTAPGGGKPFAGGYSIASPLGAIVATNITPSRTAGIGDYTEEQFARALRQGVRADGAHLYPAMPYTAYTLLADEDVRALYAYFMLGVQAVNEEPAEATQLPYPFRVRGLMAVWNALFLDDRRFEPDAGQSQQVNRGAYLGRALAHCSTCHTPRNMFMAEQGGRQLAGSPLGPWYAPNITPHASGLQGWSEQEVVQYLRTGQVPGKAQAAGPMAEAVEHSLQYLREDDLQAIAAWLRTVPAHAGEGGDTPPFARGAAHDLEPALRGRDGPNALASLDSGAKLYSGNCASCHQPDARGSDGQAYPALFHNTATGGARADNLVAAILLGVQRTVDGKQVLMPRFDERSSVNRLSDEQIAQIANHVLQQHGNAALQVSAADVAQARAGGARPFLAEVQPLLLPVGLVALALLLALAVWLTAWVRHRRRRTGPAR